MTADIQRMTRLIVVAASQPSGASAGHAPPRARRRGARAYRKRKFAAMRRPDTVNTQFLWRDTATSHGTAERKLATVVHNPTSTRSDGSAQHRSVPNEVNSDK